MMSRLTTVLCLASTLFAVSPAKAEWEGNWLIGVSGGYSDFDGNLEISYGAPAPGRQVSLLVQDLDQPGFLWGLLVGYQVRCNGWLFGAEMSFDWRNLDNTFNFAFTDALNNGWAATANYDQDVAIGVTARAGYEVNDCFMTYIRLGLDTSDESLSYTAATANNLLGASVNGSRRQYRFLGGVGAEMPIPYLANLSFRLEYNYLSKGKGVDASGFASDNLTFVDMTGRVDANIGKASFVYNFF